LDGEGNVRGEPREDSDQGEVPAGRARGGRSRGHPPRPPLSLDETAALFDATLGHAKLTLNASELLLANHYLPQAYSLGHMAVEELSKVRLLFAIWLMLATGWREPDWPGFWAAWSDHGAKNRLLIFGRVEEELRTEFSPNQEVQSQDGGAPLTPEQIASQLTQTASFLTELGVLSRAAFPLARNFHEMRLRATYVDFDNGTLLLPEAASSQVEIEAMHRFTQRTVQNLERLWQQRFDMQTAAQKAGSEMLDLMSKSYFGEQTNGS
jgi:AbiV family abortive infection protein